MKCRNQKTYVVSFNKVINNKPGANMMLQPGDMVYVIQQKSLWAASGVANVIAPIASTPAGAMVALATKK